VEKQRVSAIPLLWPVDDDFGNAFIFLEDYILKSHIRALKKSFELRVSSCRFKIPSPKSLSGF